MSVHRVWSRALHSGNLLEGGGLDATLGVHADVVVGRWDAEQPNIRMGIDGATHQFAAFLKLAEQIPERKTAQSTHSHCETA